MTNQEANLHDSKKPGCFWRFAKLCLGLVAVFILLLISFNVDKRFECIVLPNGYIIGRPSAFSDNKEWPPDYVLKDKTGKILNNIDGSISFERHPNDKNRVILDYRKNRTTHRIEMRGDEIMPLIFDEKHYKKKWNEPFKSHPHSMSIMGTNPYHVFLKLRRHPKFWRSDCETTPWFSPLKQEER